MMRIAYLTAGTGSYYCGNCLRDHALARGLRALGHQVLMTPLYLPLVTEDGAAASNEDGGGQIHFGGINVFLRHKGWARMVPGWMRKMLDGRGLLKLAGKFSGMTHPDDLGALTVSMLKGEQGRQAQEIEELAAWMKTEGRPDVICLSNVLLLGLARRLEQELGSPVVSSLQGEEGFLDSLPEPWRAESWAVLKERAAETAGFIAVSRYYGDAMTRRLSLRPERVHVVHNGIDLEGFSPAPTPVKGQVIGYMARMSPEKGLDLLVDAFGRLKERPGTRDAKLKVAGTISGFDQRFVKTLMKSTSRRWPGGDVEYHPEISRARKLEFLRELNVLSVPAVYGEAFGLYVLEALASGVPVVQPHAAAFPELLEMTGGGILCRPNDAASLADGLEELLRDPDRAQRLGLEGMGKVREGFGMAPMARKVQAILENVADGRRGGEAQAVLTGGGATGQE